MSILKRCLVISLATLLVLELVLQVGAVIVWIGHREEAPPEATGGVKTVLCIGDSFTFGQGSSNRRFSYPSQLEVLLQEKLDPSWRVINAGYPGRNSRDLLERIGGQLESYKPQFVYVIIGINDQWTQPELLDFSIPASAAAMATTGNTFRWELRTLRMLKWMSGGLLTEDIPESVQVSPPVLSEKPIQIPTALVGTWTHPNLSLAIGPDGRIELAGMTLSCSATSEILKLFLPGGESLDLEWRLEDGELLLRGSNWTEDLRLRAPPRTPHALAEQAKSSENERNFTSALELYRLAIAGAGDKANPYWYSSSVRCLTLLDRSDEAIAVIESIREQYRREATAKWAAALCTSLSRVGNRKECLFEARSALQEFPDNPFILQVFGWESFQSGEKEESVLAMERAVILSEDTNPAMRRYTRYLLARMLAENRPQRAIEVIADLYRQEDAEEQLVTVVHNVRQFIALDQVEATLPLTELTAEEQADLLEIFRSSHSPSTAVFETVETHLEQLVRLVTESGATAVLSSYPWHNDPISDIHARLRQRTRAGRLDMTPAFKEALKTTPHAELFVPDGHCNDRGYGIMAEAVFEDLRTRLAR